MKKRILISLLSGMTALSCLAQTETIDEMILGNKVSEECHALSSEGSEIIIGGLDEPARRLLPLSPASWDGGVKGFFCRQRGMAAIRQIKVGEYAP